MRGRAKIAVVTVSGKAYYKLVNELKNRGIPFLSIVPGEPIPSSVKVAITTEGEKHLVKHPRVLTYNVESDPSNVVDEALRLSSNRDFYGELVIGVDPGKTFGIAVLADGKTLKRGETSSIEETIDLILTELRRVPSKSRRIRVGVGVPDVAEEIARRLEASLPQDTIIEMVDEEGTSTSRDIGVKRKLKNADSAVRIALKRGEVRSRGVDK